MSLGRMEAKYPVIRESLFSLHQNYSNEPALSAAIRAQIGRRLRHLFDGITDPLPEKLQHALLQLESKLRGESAKK